jgi:hypothetical protein
MRLTTKHGLGPAQGLLEGMRQGGVYSKLRRTNLAGF